MANLQESREQLQKVYATIFSIPDEMESTRALLRWYDECKKTCTAEKPCLECEVQYLAEQS